MSICSCCKRKLVSTSIAVVDCKLQITIPNTSLDFKTKYCLILAQPIPEDGKALPVVILNDCSPIEVDKAPFGNIEYGEDLENCCDKTKKRIPLYFNNAGRFEDLRGIERSCFCRGV